MKKLNTRNRQILALFAYRCAFKSFESFREQNVGADLAYLMGAILGNGKVDWSKEGYGETPPPLLRVLVNEVPIGHSLWEFIKVRP